MEYTYSIGVIIVNFTMFLILPRTILCFYFAKLIDIGLNEGIFLMLFCILIDLRSYHASENVTLTKKELEQLNNNLEKIGQQD